jgi:hypothetical protein
MVDLVFKEKTLYRFDSMDFEPIITDRDAALQGRCESVAFKAHGREFGIRMTGPSRGQTPSSGSTEREDGPRSAKQRKPTPSLGRGGAGFVDGSIASAQANSSAIGLP